MRSDWIGNSFDWLSETGKNMIRECKRRLILLLLRYRSSNPWSSGGVSTQHSPKNTSSDSRTKTRSADGPYWRLPEAAIGWRKKSEQAAASCAWIGPRCIVIERLLHNSAEDEVQASCAANYLDGSIKLWNYHGQTWNTEMLLEHWSSEPPGLCEPHIGTGSVNIVI